MKHIDLKYSNSYLYKGFNIWHSEEEGWIAKPDWVLMAIYEIEKELPRHLTEYDAKKWVREVGVNLKEEDYLL